MKRYVLWYRDKRGNIFSYETVFTSAEHCLNTGEDLMDKYGWIDYSYSIVTPPDLAPDVATRLQNMRKIG